MLIYVVSVVVTLLFITLIRFQLPAIFGFEVRHLVGLKFRIIFFELNLILAYSLSTTYFFISEYFKNQQVRSEMKLRQVESELKYLKNQINPHFLFNTLNNIYTLCYLKDDKAAPSLLKLSGMMRYMLHESNTELIELEKEIQFIRNYMELQQLKKDDSMHITFDVTGIKGWHKIAPLILIVFFENCFKHGDIETNSEGWINASLCVNDKNEMNFFIANSKRPEFHENRNSMYVGLENVQKRLSLLYQDRFELKMKNEESWYSVNLVIKLNHD